MWKSILFKFTSYVKTRDLQYFWVISFSHDQSHQQIWSMLPPRYPNTFLSFHCPAPLAWAFTVPFLSRCHNFFLGLLLHFLLKTAARILFCSQPFGLSAHANHIPAPGFWGFPICADLSPVPSYFYTGSPLHPTWIHTPRPWVALSLALLIAT